MRSVIPDGTERRATRFDFMALAFEPCAADSPPSFPPKLSQNTSRQSSQKIRNFGSFEPISMSLLRWRSWLLLRPGPVVAASEHSGGGSFPVGRRTRKARDTSMPERRRFPRNRVFATPFGSGGV